MKRLIAVITAWCVALPLWGCYDNREIDQTAYVIAIGIDKGKELYNYTFQISSPLAMSSGGEVTAPESGEEDRRVQNIVIGANDLYEARNKLNNFLSKTVNLSHLKLIALSMDTAREGIDPHMTFLLREREVRPNTRLCIAEDKAEEFLRGINPALEANTAEYYDAVAENGAIYAPPKTLREFINENSLFASALPIGRVADYEESESFDKKQDALRISSSKSELSGLCLIKDYKAVGEIPPVQSELFGLITEAKKETDLSILKDGKWHMARLTPQGPATFKVNQGENGVTVNMYISFNAEVNSTGAPITEKDITEHLSREMYALFLTAQRHGCDIFRAGNCLRRKCKTIDEWERLSWNKKFEKAYFMPYINVSAERVNSGTM